MAGGRHLDARDQLGVEEAVIRLRCVDCRALLAAFDDDYQTTERDSLEVLSSSASHARRTGCSGSVLADSRLGDIVVEVSVA